MMTGKARLALSVGAGVFSVAAILLIQYRKNRQYGRHLHEVTPSPLKTVIPHLSKAEIEALAYKPDHFPGSRDVETPFGTCRVYEFGPENGPKVLFVPGISTPCLSLGRLAYELVDRGCRVILYDLPGRGYTDNPTHHEHSSQLYISQILCVLASSPISWNGDNSFSIIGYSLGGGIASAFTYHFPNLIRSLVLITPSGLVRERHIAWQSYFLYRTQGILPESAVTWLVRRRLDNPAASHSSTDNQIRVDNAVSAEIGSQSDPISRIMDSAVQWQLDHHQGFIPAFISAIRHAPITAQFNTYRKIGERLKRQKEENLDFASFPDGLAGAKVILILGAKDNVVIPSEHAADYKDILGEDHLETIIMEAGHDVPISHSEELARWLWSVWQTTGNVD